MLSPAHLLGVGCILALAWHAPACRASATGGSENVAVALLSESASIRPGEPFRVGLWMKMEEGWHTYWKHAGDAGLPLRIDWKLPAGFTAGAIEWPAPERIPTGELMSYGYGREVLLPVTITPPASLTAKSVTIAGTFDWLECKEVCLPASARLDLAVAVRPEPSKPGPAAPLFSEARARMPRSPERWVLSAAAGPRAIELTFQPPPGVTPRGGYLYVDQPLIVEHAEPQGFERAGPGYRLTAVPAVNADPPRRLTGVLVLDGVPRSKGNALYIDVEVAPGDPAPSPVKRPWPAAQSYAILAVVAGLALAIVLRRARGRRVMPGDPDRLPPSAS